MKIKYSYGDNRQILQYEHRHHVYNQGPHYHMTRTAEAIVLRLNYYTCNGRTVKAVCLFDIRHHVYTYRFTCNDSANKLRG